MATVPKTIKAAMRFAKASPEKILAYGYTVVKSMRGNPNFANTPVDLDALSMALDTYSDLIGDAKDSRKAKLLRDKQGEEIIRMLRSLASYVEFHCKDDLHLFLTSGFEPRSSPRSTPQPLDESGIDYVDQGITGQLLVWIKRVRNAKTYELRFGPAESGGVAPASWSTHTVSNVKSATALDGLNPGVVYVIQVRAFGSLGYTEWSDSSSRMCI